MTAPATRSTPYDSRTSNPTAAVASLARLDVSISLFAPPRRKCPGTAKVPAVAISERCNDDSRHDRRQSRRRSVTAAGTKRRPSSCARPQPGEGHGVVTGGRRRIPG